MSDDSRALAENYDYAVGETASVDSRRGRIAPVPEIPDYLQDTYWWAYLHPKSFYFFEREWVVNLILWGNMRRLTQSVLDETRPEPGSRVLQVACVYGDFSNRVCEHLDESDSRLDIVDVAPIQLQNVRKKLDGRQNVGFHHQDSSALTFAADSFDQSVVFFLLHEQPEDVRRKTIAEAIRVTRPGGKVIFVDYHGPKKRNPMRYVMKPILSWLEPFAMDLWREELTGFLPDHIQAGQIQSEYYFGGLYQKVVLTV
ncbi:MAG: rhodoquinone biosynthesis methyltransferase RquA [Gammaproteobacteria bacterium]|nr:rhodoquinone biosynthesis methyltransferase RquA [Gammaproteobacteria bacterium]